MQEAEVVEDCYTKQGITLAVQAVIAFKVGDDHESIAAAARRFQGDQTQMPTLVGRIFSGHLRSIIGSMTVEAIIREQQTLADAIVDASKTEMARIGLAVDSLQISSIDDKGVGYIQALAAPHQARVNQDAKIAQAAADQASAMAQQESVRHQAEYARQTAIAQAQYQAEIDQAQQTAAQSGPLAAARPSRTCSPSGRWSPQQNAELRQAELIAEVVRPAEAEAERIRALARAAGRRHQAVRRGRGRPGPDRPRPGSDPAAAGAAAGRRRRACRAPTSPCWTAPRGSTAWSRRSPRRG